MTADFLDGEYIGEPKDWSIWGDGVEPVYENCTYSEMKEIVDEDSTDTLYGQHVDGQTYEGPE